MRILQVGPCQFESKKKTTSVFSFISKQNVYSKTLAPLERDTVSFKGVVSVASPSRKHSSLHCAYCDTKVYTEQEIKQKAKDFCSYSDEQLFGDIRSILDKLGYNNFSNELAEERGNVNQGEISFFKSIRDYAKKHTNNNITGGEIVSELYKTSTPERLVEENLDPIKLTEEHIYPQYIGSPHTNNKINKIPTCKTCNSRIKKDKSFSEFYALYETIKDVMPSDVFDFALSNGLEVSSDTLDTTVDTADKFGYLKSLYSQSRTCQNRISSLTSKLGQIAANIIQAKSDVQKSLDEILADKSEKSRHKLELEHQLEKLSQNPDFALVCDRARLTKIGTDLQTRLDAVEQKLAKDPRRISQLEKSTKGVERNPKRLPQSVVDHKLKQIADKIRDISYAIAANKEEKTNLVQQIADNNRALAALNGRLPQISTLEEQIEALKYDMVSDGLPKEIHDKIAEMTTRIDNQEAEKQKLAEEYEKRSKNARSNDKLEDYKLQEVEVDRLKTLISQTDSSQDKLALKKQLRGAESILRELEKSSIVQEYKEINALKHRIDKYTRRIDALKAEISEYKESCKGVCCPKTKCSDEELQEQIGLLEKQIAYYQELEAGIAIKSKINQLEIEIGLLDSSYDQIKRQLDALPND